jgi:hypothetical protein
VQSAVRLGMMWSLPEFDSNTVYVAASDTTTGAVVTPASIYVNLVGCLPLIRVAMILYSFRRRSQLTIWVIYKKNDIAPKAEAKGECQRVELRLRQEFRTDHEDQ